MIIADVAAQRPSEEFARLLRRKRRFEMAGVVSLTTAGIIGLCLLLANAFYAKLHIFGPAVLFGSATIALLAFAIASIFFFNYPKLFMKMDRVNPRLDPGPASDRPSPTTNKLLADPPFSPASVTEHSTELIGRKS